MKLILTGQSGQAKSSFLEEVKRCAASKAKTLYYESSGKLMLKKLGGKFQEQNILNLPLSLLKLLRSNAHEQVLRLIEKNGSDFFVLNTHSVFRWQHGMFPCLDLDFVLELDPDMIICLIDDILSIKDGLLARNTDIFNLWELFAWREEEVWFSKFIADSVGKIKGREIPFYIYPKKGGTENFYNLISKNEIKKAYLSFPITGIHGAELEEIESFKIAIGKKLVVFDPYAIKDRELILTYHTLKDEIDAEVMPDLKKAGFRERQLFPDAKWYIELEDVTPLSLATISFPPELRGRDLLSVIKAIDSQIISRDHLLIDQSDVTVIYIKEDNGVPRISAGCQSELVHAYENGKPVYVIYRGGESKLSPWVTQYSKLFETAEACLDFLNL